MDSNEVIKNTIPDPFSKESTLSDVAKKGELVSEGISIASIGRRIAASLVFAVILTIIFKLPPQTVAIVIGVQLLTTAIAAYISIKKIKSVYSTETGPSDKNYRSILITREYYELIKTTYNVVTESITILVILFFFSQELSSFFTDSTPVQPEMLMYIVLLFVSFRIFNSIIKFVKYNSVKKIAETEDLAVINQEYQLIGKKLDTVRAVPAFSAILLVLFLIGIPTYIIVLFGAFFLLLVVISIVELKRISATDLNNGIDPSVVQHTIEGYHDEKITSYVFGIMKTATTFLDIFKPTGMSFLGRGKTFFPENTLLVTNNRLLFIQVPVTGGNKIVGGADYSTSNFYYNREEIKRIGEEILKTSSFPQILKFSTRDILLSDIKTLTLKQTQIIIEKTNGKKVSYIFMDREYMEPLKQSFQLYLGGKFKFI